MYSCIGLHKGTEDVKAEYYVPMTGFGWCRDHVEELPEMVRKGFFEGRYLRKVSDPDFREGLWESTIDHLMKKVMEEVSGG